MDNSFKWSGGRKTEKKECLTEEAIHRKVNEIGVTRYSAKRKTCPPFDPFVYPADITIKSNIVWLF